MKITKINQNYNNTKKQQPVFKGRAEQRIFMSVFEAGLEGVKEDTTRIGRMTKYFGDAFETLKTALTGEGYKIYTKVANNISFKNSDGDAINISLEKPTKGMELNMLYSEKVMKDPRKAKPTHNILYFCSEEDGLSRCSSAGFNRSDVESAFLDESFNPKTFSFS